MSEPVIQVEGVSVCYRLPQENIPTFKEYAIRWLGRRVTYKQFWALRGVSLSVRPGEVVGIVGPNGAGKSTLLKVIARVLKPAAGRVHVDGRVGPLLELAAGFDAELTGRENIYLYGAILGLSRRQIDERFDSIVEFAELADFIDAPLRTYSSGMVARLGFSVVTDADANILLVDEVLSVGDENFARKCKVRMQRYRDEGAAILLVSHSMDTIRAVCDRAVFLTGGRIMEAGDTDRIIALYRGELLGAAPAGPAPSVEPPPAPDDETPVFTDVPIDHPARPWIEALVHAHIMPAWSADGRRFGPDEEVLRSDAAVYLLKAIHGGDYTPPPATGRVFADVTAANPDAAWIEQLYSVRLTVGSLGADGVTRYYRPDHPILRGEFAVMLIRARHGHDAVPTPATGSVFADLPIGHWAGAWVEALAADSTVLDPPAAADASPRYFRADYPLTRAEAARFLASWFHLPLATPTLIQSTPPTE